MNFTKLHLFLETVQDLATFKNKFLEAAALKIGASRSLNYKCISSFCKLFLEVVID
jgi:hypothetical protein